MIFDGKIKDRFPQAIIQTPEFNTDLTHPLDRPPQRQTREAGRVQPRTCAHDTHLLSIQTDLRALRGGARL